MTYVAIWLYVWGALLMAGANLYIEKNDGVAEPSPHFLGAMFWPIVFPFIIVRRLVFRRTTPL